MAPIRPRLALIGPLLPPIFDWLRSGICGEFGFKTGRWDRPARDRPGPICGRWDRSGIQLFGPLGPKICELFGLGPLTSLSVMVTGPLGKQVLVKEGTFRAGFWPESSGESLKIGPPAGRRPAGGPIGVFPMRIRPTLSPKVLSLQKPAFLGVRSP